MGVERALERGRVDAVDAVHLLAPLHGAAGDVPEPPADVGQRLALAQAGLGLGERRLRQALLGEVAGDADARRSTTRLVADRAQRQRDRDAACRPLALDIGLELVDAVAAERPLSSRHTTSARTCAGNRSRTACRRRPRRGGRRCARRCGSTRRCARPRRWLNSASCDASTNASRQASRDRIARPRRPLTVSRHRPPALGGVTDTPPAAGVREPRRRTLSHTAEARRRRRIGGTAASTATSAPTSRRAALTLARRFAAGATMWCVAPRLARARPPRRRRVRPPGDHRQAGAARGRASTDADPVAALRAMARGRRRARRRRRRRRDRSSPRCCAGPQAWGLTTVWIGAGARPPAGLADHVAVGRRRRPGPPATTVGSCCCYHVLWELTHVCFEHPGLLDAPAAECDDGVCITCSDEGRLGRGASARRRDGLARGAHGARRRDGRHHARRRRSQPATSCSSTPAPPSRGGAVDGRVTDFLYPFIERRRARRAAAARRPRPLGARPRRRQRRAAATRRSSATATRRSTRVAGAMADALRAPAAGCSPSATAAAPPTPPSLAALFAAPPCGPAAARPAAWSTTTAVLTALGNDVGFDLVFSRQLIAHGRAGDIALGLSTSGNSRNLLVAFAEARAPRPAHRRSGRLRRRRDGRARRTSTTASSSRPTASTASRRRRRALAFALWARGAASARWRHRWLTRRPRRPRGRGPRAHRGVPPPPAPPHRRGRHARPRRRRQGVGRARRRGVPRGLRRRRARRRCPTPPRSTLPGGERLAFSTDSFVVQPRRFPGGSIGHLAVHGTVNDLAMQGARPAWLSAAFVIEEGFAGRRAARRSSPTWPRRPRPPASRSSPATPRSSAGARPTACTSRPPASASCPPGAQLGPEQVQPGDVVLVSGTIGDHGMAVMLARGDLALEADIRSDTAPLGDLVEDAARAPRPAPAGCATRRAAGVGTVCNELARDAGLAVVLDEAALPVRPGRRSAPATCSASTRCTSPTRARSSPSSPADEADAGARRDASPPARRRRGRASARSPPSPRASSCCAPRFGGTRIVDMLVGDPLPRIC